MLRNLVEPQERKNFIKHLTTTSYKDCKEYTVFRAKVREITETHACELMDYIIFMEITEQELNLQIIIEAENRKRDVLALLFTKHDEYIKKNYLDIIKTATTQTGYGFAINALRSCLALNFLPTREQAEKIVACGYNRKAYKKLFEELGLDIEYLSLSFDGDAIDPLYTMDDCKEEFIDREEARLKRTGKYPETIRRRMAEHAWEEKPPTAQNRLFNKYRRVVRIFD